MVEDTKTIGLKTQKNNNPSISTISKKGLQQQLSASSFSAPQASLASGSANPSAAMPIPFTASLAALRK
jgi:hypothetical protein